MGSVERHFNVLLVVGGKFSFLGYLGNSRVCLKRYVCREAMIGYSSSVSLRLVRGRFITAEKTIFVFVLFFVCLG